MIIYFSLNTSKSKTNLQNIYIKTKNYANKNRAYYKCNMSSYNW